MQPIVEFQNICKEYPGVVANNNVSFKIIRQSIHAILGENGAGKSTLVKILYGHCLLYTSPSTRDRTRSRMPSSA